MPFEQLRRLDPSLSRMQILWLKIIFSRMISWINTLLLCFLCSNFFFHSPIISLLDVYARMRPNSMHFAFNNDKQQTEIKELIKMFSKKKKKKKGHSNSYSFVTTTDSHTHLKFFFFHQSI